MVHHRERVPPRHTGPTGERPCPRNMPAGSISSATSSRAAVENHGDNDRDSDDEDDEPRCPVGIPAARSDRFHCFLLLRSVPGHGVQSAPRVPGQSACLHTKLTTRAGRAAGCRRRSSRARPTGWTTPCPCPGVPAPLPSRGPCRSHRPAKASVNSWSRWPQQDRESSSSSTGSGPPWVRCAMAAMGAITRLQAYNRSPSSPHAVATRRHRASTPSCPAPATT